MAISMNNGGGGGRSRRRGHMGALAEINVTPFVDVVLVLLIIFMLTAHAMDYGLEVDVPKVRGVAKSSDTDLPVVSILKDGEIYLNDKPVNNINLLKAEIQQRFGTAKAVYVKADKETIWEIIAQVVQELGLGGFQVNMVTQPDDSRAKG